MFMQQHKQSDLDSLKLWLNNNVAVAVGEIGLDFFIPEQDKNNKKSQIKLFVAQLEIAKEQNSPVYSRSRPKITGYRT